MYVLFVSTSFCFTIHLLLLEQRHGDSGGNSLKTLPVRMVSIPKYQRIGTLSLEIEFYLIRYLNLLPSSNICIISSTPRRSTLLNIIYKDHTNVVATEFSHRGRAEK